MDLSKIYIMALLFSAVIVLPVLAKT